MNDILNDLSESALVAAIEANRVLFAADLGRSTRIELYRDASITWFISDVSYPSFNRVLCARFETGQIDEQIEAALNPFRARGLPMIWQTGPTDRPVDLEARLEAHGLVHIDHEPGMAADLCAIDLAAPAPPGLETRHVEDLGRLRAWTWIAGRAFGAPEWMQDQMFAVEASLGLGGEARRLYIGLLEAEPVAISLLFLGTGVAGIYSVGVLPGARRKGCGKAMTLVALSEARALGYRVATLHASPLGQGIYRQIGFREYCRLGRYKYRGS